MPSDFAFNILVIPVGLGIVALLFVGIRAKPATTTTAGAFFLGRKRIALGFLGAVVATFLCAYVSALTLGFEKASFGHIASAELPSWVSRGGFYFFVLATPFVVGALAFLALPLLACLAKLHLASIFGMLLIAIVCSGIFAGIYLAQEHFWCNNHLGQCAGQILGTVLGPSVVIALGFGLGARLPLIWSHRSNAT